MIHMAFIEQRSSPASHVSLSKLSLTHKSPECSAARKTYVELKDL